MTTARRNLLWPLVVIALGGIWLLAIADAFPDAIRDLLTRVWPVLLILFGFDVLFGRRQIRLGRRSASLSAAAVVLAMALVAGLVWTAYARQADELRTDNVQSFAEVVPAEAGRVEVHVKGLRTAVTLASGEARTVAADYTGSNESDVVMDWSVSAGVATLAVTETQSDAIPMLADYGRGTLAITLPRDVAVSAVSVENDDGDISADLRPLQVDQVSLVAPSGDLTLYLPENNVMRGTLRTDDGSVTVYVPPEMRLYVKALQGVPRYEFDSTMYDELADGALKHKEGEPYQYSLDVAVKKGGPVIINDLGVPSAGQ